MHRDIGTKLFMESFNRYIEENGIELTEENADNILHEFMHIYNANRRKIMAGEIEKSDDEKISDLLEEAYEASETKAKKLVKKALEINPDHIPAQLLAIQLENNAMNQLIKLTALEEKERVRLEKECLETGYEIDNYHLDLKGRDYLKIVFELCQQFIIMGMYARAREVAMYGLTLDDMDHPGFHKIIISLSLLLEDYEEAYSWLEGYEYDTPTSLLYKAILEYKQFEIDKAIKYIHQICEKYPDVKKSVTQNLSDSTIERIMMSDNAIYFQQFVETLQECSFLFNENAMFDWMIETMKAYKKPKKSKSKTILN